MKRSGGRLWGRVIVVLAVLALLVPAGFTAVQMGVFSDEPPMEITPMYPDAPTLRVAADYDFCPILIEIGIGAEIIVCRL